MKFNGKKILRVMGTILKYTWVPALMLVALAFGLYIGYGYITKSPREIFDMDIWKQFINQLKSL